MGHPVSDETRLKFREKAGEKHSNWQGGITPINQAIRNSFEYKLWRTAVFERDNYTCIWCGARSGQGEGFCGESYAIPTKDAGIKTLPLTTIKGFVRKFLAYASKHPHLTFYITKIGCGLAGYKEASIAPMFKGAPKNCVLPKGWLS